MSTLLLNNRDGHWLLRVTGKWVAEDDDGATIIVELGYEKAKELQQVLMPLWQWMAEIEDLNAYS